MADHSSAAPHGRDNASGEKGMSRLADRLAALARPSAAVAALSTSAAIAARADRRARRPRSIISMTVESFVAACEYIPYALVLLARLFFLDGQARIDGPRVPINAHEP